MGTEKEDVNDVSGKADSEGSEVPWSHLTNIFNNFIIDLDCISEMISLVLPVLENKDDEREKRTKNIYASIEGDDPIDYFKIKEFIRDERRLKRADIMYRQSIITMLVTKFDEYFTEVLNVCYEKNPHWLISSEKKLSYQDVLEIKSLESFKKDIIYKDIDSLMRGSHNKQITFIDEKLKLGIAKHFDKYIDFLEIAERRNLFVHNGGIVSSVYFDNCKKLGIPIKNDIKEGECADACNTYLIDAIDCLYELGTRIHQSVSRRLYNNSYIRMDDYLNEDGVELLREGRWELAERIFDYAITIPEKMKGGEIELYFIINKCIALKSNDKTYELVLDEVKWSKYHPMYHFAVAVLKDDYQKASDLMKEEVVHQKIGKEAFADWPLLKDFRATKLFQDTFYEIFEISLNELMKEEVECMNHNPMSKNEP